jgi:casein kinase 1
MNQNLPKGEISIGNNYSFQLSDKLGSGSFGEIYKGKNIKLNKEVAIKCEPLKDNHHQRLKYESGVLKCLKWGFIPSIRYPNYI